VKFQLTVQVRALIKLGHEVLTICGCPKGALEGSPAPNVLPIPIPVWGRLDAACSWKEFADGCCTPQIVRRVHEFDPEVVIGIDWHSVTVYHYLTATLASVGHRRPLAYIYSNYRVYLRSVDSEIKGEKDLIAELEGQALALSACSTVLSRSDLEFVQQQYATALAGVQRPIHVLLPALRSDMASIPPPPSFTNCATPAEHWQHRMYLTCCVRASPEKEPHRFVEAVCELEKRGVFDALGIVPLVAGAGWADGTGGDYAQRLRQWLRGQVPQCVIVDSFLSPDELADIYARTALNVHPPAYDAYGMTVVEAASQGTVLP